jgi:hypothetical protein
MVGILFITSCERKELFYPPKIKLKVNVHWSDKLEDKPLHNKIIFYPTDGNGVLQKFYLDSDSEILPVIPGKYNVILYNWRTNASAQTVQFKNEDSYMAMKSFTGKLTNRSGHFNDFNIHLSPDMLLSWSTEYLLPTKSVVYNSEPDFIVLDTYPKEVTKVYKFHVEVVGLEYVRAVSAITSGFSPELEMYDQKGDEMSAGHKLEIQTTQSGFQCQFSAYNHWQENDQKLHFFIKLPDGSIQVESRDVNAELDEKGDIKTIEKIILKYDGPIDPEPPEGGDFNPPEIGDWVDNQEDVVFS